MKSIRESTGELNSSGLDIADMISKTPCLNNNNTQKASQNLNGS